MALSPSGSSKRDENYAIQAAATCLVDECATDLRNCRNYYQRHKVCELHSKSPQVSVKGQNLRFCQQCSRFHLLEEFDEGKRSCRKRLDGHNRRRRKPRPYIFSPRHGSNTLQFAGPQMHPTMAFTNPQLSSVGEAPTWVDHSKYAPSLLSCSGSPPHASSTTLTHAMNIQSDSGSVSTTASPLDPRLCYDGLENDIDLGWGSMTDMGSHYHASFDHQDPQTLPFFWQYQ